MAIACGWAIISGLSICRAATVRGQLACNNRPYPAAGVAVTVFSTFYGRSTPSRTGTDGMYYLYNVPPGIYTLEVWINPNAPLQFQIQVYNVMFSDVASLPLTCN